MLPIEFLRASHTILTALLACDSKRDCQTRLESMLKGEYGDDILRILLEVQIALDRSALISILPFKTRTILYDFETHAFKALSASGVFDDAVKVLTERMQSGEGVSVMANEVFQTIRVNIRHIQSLEDEIQERYWRKRIKDFKFSLQREFRNYITAAHEAVHSTSSSFNTASSEIMNILLDYRRIAEKQQHVLIASRTSGAQTNNNLLVEMNKALLIDFLREAAAGSNAVVFARRLQAMIDRCVPLSAFEEAYTRLQELTGKELRVWRELIKNYELNCRMVLIEFQKRIDELINVMDFHSLPEEIHLDEFISPLIKMTEHIFAIMRELAETWLHAIKEAISGTQKSAGDVTPRTDSIAIMHRSC